jgi:uncharacterized protein (TIGR02217 family)
MTERIFTGVESEVLGAVASPNRLFTEAYAKVLGFDPDPTRQFTGVRSEILGHLPGPPRLFTGMYAQILATRTPLYEFIPLILADVFPFDISYNSVGSTRFATDVVMVDSGDDQRIGRWDQPLMEYDVAYGIRTMEQLLALIAFFRAMRGRLYAFCYQDNTDYTSSFPVAYEARKAPPITPADQVQMSGDASTYIFQLIKTYASTSQQQSRVILRPQPGTVRVAINGIEVFNFTVDDTLGVVTFTPPLSVTGTFSKSAISGPNARISGAPGDFTAFTPFTSRKMITSGWAHAGNNIDPTLVSNLADVAGDGSYIDISYPAAHGIPAEGATAGVTVALHPAPVAAALVTAGFLFYVPCRFDTDILPVTIEDYGVGGSNSVKLVEVRGSSNNP